MIRQLRQVRKDFQDKGAQGQLFIFVAISLTMLMALMAFVINVGLFVRAKINLQNAVDAAAWSGAAVQARQLSNIAYLNWELRNTYKEFMYKYYVLGQLSVSGARPGSEVWQASGNKMDYRMVPFDRASSPDAFERYNVPSICIHTVGTNICNIFDIPGLPHFKLTGIPGIDEKHQAFLDEISKRKADNCSLRTMINFMVASHWIFGVGNDLPIFEYAPQIASGRMGAWTEAFELAIRIRNLEAMVNRPPIGELCLNCGVSPQSLSPHPVNERPLKAFWAAHKNLGGKNTNGGALTDLQKSLKIAELAPTPLNVDSSSLSGFLIPSNSGNSEVPAPLNKYYLDLQVIPLNLAVFYTAFVSAQDTSRWENVPSHAACLGTRTAIPVPGYIFGFIKNQQVLTYYSVKAEAKYVGMFYPFKDPEGITLKAYATAKPYGGRIGPRIFDVQDNNKGVKVRGILSQSDPKRGLPFVSSMVIDGGGKKFIRGYPVPLDPDFWASNPDDSIGGIPGQGSNVKFVIPNMVYDLVEDMKRHSDANQAMMPFTPQGSYAKGSVAENYGLFSKPQFETLLNFLPTPSGSNFAVSPEEVAMALNNARAPTWYDALNFLIPTYQNQKEKIETPSVVAKPTHINENVYRYNLYAPFYGENTLYQTLEEVKGVLDNFIQDSHYAISRYVQTMHEVATEIRTQSTAVDANKKHIYLTAANGFHNNPNDPNNPGCNSQAGLFKQLFLGGSGPDGTCNIKPMPEQLKDYWSSGVGGGSSESYQTFYTMRPDTPDSNSTYMTGYMPGIRQGALDNQNGTVSLPFSTNGENDLSISRRNFYSTKFISTDKVIQGSAFAYVSQSFSAYNDSEQAMNGGSVGAGINTGSGSSFVNTLSSHQLTEFAPLSY